MISVTWLGLLVILAVVISFVMIRNPRARVPVLIGVGVMLFLMLTVNRMDRSAPHSARESAHATLTRSSRPVSSDSLDRASAGSERKAPSVRESGAPSEAVGSWQGPKVELVDDFDWWNKESATFDFKPITSRLIQTSPSKAWIDGAGSIRVTRDINGTRFSYWEPGEGNGLVAYSPTDPEILAAQRSAHLLLRDKIALLTLSEAKDQDGQLQVERLFPLAQNIAERRLRHLNVDHSLQSTSQNYGELFRVASHTEVTNQTLDSMKTELLSEVRRGWVKHQMGYRRTLWAILYGFAAALGILVLYCLMNAKTKGYFAWPLRIAACCALVAIVFVVYLVRVKLTGV